MSQVAREYFAAQRDPNEIASQLWGRYERCLSDPFDPRPLFANAHAHLYGEGSDAGVTYGVARMGAQGEIAAVRLAPERRWYLTNTFSF